MVENSSDREKEIDRLVREEISKIMNVPMNMISTDTELYKTTYEKYSKKVPKDFTTKPIIDKNETEREGTTNANKNRILPRPRINPSYNNSNASDYKNENEKKTDDVNKMPRNNVYLRDDKSRRMFSEKIPRADFNIHGKDIKRKENWFNLPTRSELEKYSKENDICKNLVKIYLKRFKSVEKQILELKTIASDIDKYSNYKLDEYDKKDVSDQSDVSDDEHED